MAKDMTGETQFIERIKSRTQSGAAMWGAIQALSPVPHGDRWKGGS